MTDLNAILSLAFYPALSAAKARLLIEHTGSAEKACQLANIASTTPQVEKELEALEKLNIKLIPITSNEYPEKLKILPDCPLVLYVKGTLPPTGTPCLGIVGTRAATDWGKECATVISRDLAASGCCIVSGLARGIDTAAHSGSLRSGLTVAFIGSGLANIYPAENTYLAEKIAEKGAVISELPLHTSPTRYTFPRRNRLISAFSDALLIAEAPIKSGAMITMEIGYKQNKPLFALPGRAMSDTHSGNHLLIKSGKATLVDRPEELAAFLHLEALTKTKIATTSQLLGPDEKKIVDFLSQSEVSLNELSCVTSFPIPSLQVMLIQLILKNLVEELPGKRYKLKR